MSGLGGYPQRLRVRRLLLATLLVIFWIWPRDSRLIRYNSKNKIGSSATATAGSAGVLAGAGAALSEAEPAKTVADNPNILVFTSGNSEQYSFNIL